MKKTLIAFAALPAIFGAVGFGAAKVMAPEPAPAVHAAAPAAETTGAEATLDKLATESPAPEHHDDSFARPGDQGEGHDARLIPASATVPEDGHGDNHAAAAEPKADHGSTHAAPAGDSHAAAAPARTRAPKPEREVSHASQSAAAQRQARETAQRASGHSLAPEPGEGMMTMAQLNDSKVVKLGRVTVPVQKASSVSYVVTELGVSVHDVQAAAHFNEAENATRLRDAILVSMHRIAGTPMMNGSDIDPGELSDTLSSDLKRDFGKDVDEVLFLSLYKAEVPRS